MDSLPVCEVDRLQVGPVGVTLGATDNGGGAGMTLIIIPAVKVKWFDERQTCPAVLAFMHDGDAPDLAACQFYRAGECGRMADHCCAFAEPEDSEIWRKAADWQMLPGGGVVHRDLWPVFGLERMP